MTALSDAKRAAIHRDTDGNGRRSSKRAVPADVSPPDGGVAAGPPSGKPPSWRPSRGFFAAVIAIGGMQLLATMDSTVAIVALPRIQDELSLSDAGRSWVITAWKSVV